MFSSWLQTENMSFGKLDHRVPSSLHHIKSTYRQHSLRLLMLTLSPGWGCACQVSLLRSYSFPHFLYSDLQKKITMCSLYLRNWELRSIFLRGEYPHTLFGILSSAPFIYSLTYLYQHGHISALNYLLISAWTRKHYFILQVAIPYYFILLFKLLHLWPLELFQLAPCPSDKLTSVSSSLFF